MTWLGEKCSNREMLVEVVIDLNGSNTESVTKFVHSMFDMLIKKIIDIPTGN
jgi:hypothetical protein